MDYKGLLLCARYSSAPNFYGYCGPNENETLVGNLAAKDRYREIASILSEFETLYLYLRLISYENRVPDPFDQKVVEAYWIGNKLLNNVQNVDYGALLEERFAIEKKIGFKKYLLMRRKILGNKLYPHHSFHVFNVFKRTGHDPSFHTLETMNECRVGWGKIRMEIGGWKRENITVETQPLVMEKGKLKLGKPFMKNLKTDYRGKSFLKGLNPGDWVSFHWGFVCDRLTLVQVRNLQFYTQKSIDFYNT